MLTFEQLMRPIWASETIYDESLTMINQNGVCAAPLLFAPEAILSVTSADKTHAYSDGQDYALKNGRLVLTESSRIFRFEESELIFDVERPGRCFPRKDGRYSLFSEGHFFHDRQISVTYTRKGGEFGAKPRYCKNLLPKTIGKLEIGEPVSVLLYGDSISEGYNSSGFTLTTPFLPGWGALLCEALRRRYRASVRFINTSRGGEDAAWGAREAQARAADYLPDLAIIAFGMNGRMPPEVFMRETRKIIDTIKAHSPETEYILCATTYPNAELTRFPAYQELYGDCLRTLEDTGTAVADFYAMQMEMLKRKRFIDLTGNNVNHPNDFMARCHAQYVFGMLTENI